LRGTYQQGPDRSSTERLQSGNPTRPKNAIALHNRAAGYFSKGDYDRVVVDLDRVLQLDPKNAMAYANRCAALINKGEADRALSDCNQAIQLDPKNAPTRFGYQ
jgi:Tfp pilus assembly protein PilF